jgi:hypothetical protein
VWYVPGARANLISQHYLQKKKYLVTMEGEEQCIAFLTKGNVRIKFNKINGLYRLWSHVVGSSQQMTLGVSLLEKRNRAK